MPIIRRLHLAMLALLALNSPLAWAVGQTAAEELKQIRGHLSGAKQEADWAGYLAAAQQQSEFLGGSPLSRLELARAHVQLHQDTAALDDLGAYVRMGQASSFIDTAADFQALRQSPAFSPLHRKLLENQRPISHAKVAFRLSDAHLLPEDIDYDPQRQRFLVTSVLQHKVISIDKAGQVSDFLSAPDAWPLLALKIDAGRQVLWVSEVAIAGFKSVPLSDQGRSALLRYDLASGRLMRRIEGPHPSALGDIALTAQGDVIAADGDHGGIYRLKANGDQWERLDGGDFISPQTVVPAPDGTHLYVPDYTRGIGVLDMQSKQVKWLASAGRFALGGIDGMYGVDDRLIAVQNGTDPERVIQFSIDPISARVLSEVIIERSTATLGDPTHAVLVAGSLYYIANSGWDALNDAGESIPGKNPTAPLIMRAAVPLP